ncbi:MAG: thiamine-phosphate kinase [Aquificae bacterium]|nr:thiamine-phosphate kinase [Aquificota bacterium]
MEIKDLGEFGLIERLTQILSIKDHSVLVGFGDDCSCIDIKGEKILFTSDIQLEGRHFIKRLIQPEDLGWKVVSVNVSDIVACGGEPKWGFISVGFPKDLSVEYVENIYKGIKKACDFYKMSVIGGNTTASDSIFLDLFLTGKTDRFVPRGGAEEGQMLMVCGYLGEARAGLEIAMEKGLNNLAGYEKRLIKRFSRPTADIHLSDRLSRYASAGIDISDGLVADLYHLSKASGVEVILDKNKLPVSPDLKRYCQQKGKDPLEYILYGGEDYKVVFTVDKRDTIQFPECKVIGFIGAKGEGVFLKDGSIVKKLEKKGFSHL